MDSVFEACTYFKEKQKLDTALLKKIGLRVKTVSKKNNWEKFIKLSKKNKNQTFGCYSRKVF